MGRIGRYREDRRIQVGYGLTVMVINSAYTGPPYIMYLTLYTCNLSPYSNLSPYKVKSSRGVVIMVVIVTWLWDTTTLPPPSEDRCVVRGGRRG